MTTYLLQPDAANAFCGCPCAGVTLECETVSASKTKCCAENPGFAGFSCPPFSSACYRTRTVTLTRTCSGGGSGGTWTRTVSVDAATCAVTDTSSTPSFTCFGTTVCSVSESDEYTTAQLVANTIAALPAWSGSFAAGSCTALRDISPDEATCTLRRMRYRFSFASAGHITITWDELFTPESGAPVRTTKSWSGAGVAASATFQIDADSEGVYSIDNVRAVRL